MSPHHHCEVSLPFKAKETGEKNVISPQKFPWGVGKFPALVGQSWQPQAGFADAGEHAGSCESEFSVSAGICCWQENIWTKSAGICAIIGPVWSPASSKGC